MVSEIETFDDNRGSGICQAYGQILEYEIDIGDERLNELISTNAIVFRGCFRVCSASVKNGQSSQVVLFTVVILAEELL